MQEPVDRADMSSNHRGRAAVVIAWLAALAAWGILTKPSQYSYSMWSTTTTASSQRLTSVEPIDTAGTEPELLIDDPHMIGSNAAVVEPDAPFVLDFAIVGYPKTATSFVLGWLAEHEQVLAHTSEMYELQHGRVDQFVTAMARLVPRPTTNATSRTSASSTPPHHPHYRRGYKAPRDIQNPVVMKVLHDHWPETKLIVGLRHPVLWFESFYNYRVRHGITLPSPNSSEFLQEPTCTPSLTHGVCVSDARFHVPIAQLGLTPMTSPHELQLLQGMIRRRRPILSRHKVFLYEMSQVYESTKPSGGPNATDVDQRGLQFRRDLARFLGLTTPLSDTYSEPGHYLPNRTQALRICDDQHAELRRRLMQNARTASTWIREYLLAPSNDGDVMVSSPQHFAALLRTWMVDPCRRTRK